MLTISSIDTVFVSKSAFRCPHCAGTLSEWLNLHDLLAYLDISNTQRIRLQQQGFIPQPTTTLGDRSLRWRRSEIDAALEAGRRIGGVLTPRGTIPRVPAPDNSADAMVDAAVRAITGAGEPAAPESAQATEWR